MTYSNERTVQFPGSEVRVTRGPGNLGIKPKPRSSRVDSLSEGILAGPVAQVVRAHA